jgi:polysaccharide biosynthesis protein PslH
MKILQLCKKFPFPLKDGEAIAVTNLSRGLHTLGCDLTLLAMNTSKHYFEATEIPPALHHYDAVHTVEINNHIKPFDAFCNLFERESYHLTRFISTDFEQKLKELLCAKKYDVIILETVILAPYIACIRQYAPQAMITMRAHNVEHEIWKRVADTTNFKLRKWYLQLLNGRLRRFEVENLQNYDLLMPITARDERIFQLLGYRGQSLVAPVGMDIATDFSELAMPLTPPTIGFIGSLDWIPNQEGLRWFFNEIWHKIHEKYPNTVFHIAGRNAPTWLRELTLPNVIFHGEVPDSRDFIQKHAIMVAPLLSGSGIRVKILEAMAMGRVVVTTRIGAEGIAAPDGKAAFIAKTAEAFTQKLDWCLANPTALPQIGETARQFVAQTFDNLSIAQQVAETFERLGVKKTNKIAVVENS